jgi:hypothetical protein
MFDALERVGYVPPQVPQRLPDEKPSPSAPLVGLIAGGLGGYFSRELLPPKKLAIAGLFVWGASYLTGKGLYAEPHDYFGRDNAPSPGAITSLSLVSSFGSTWAIHGLYSLWKSR